MITTGRIGDENWHIQRQFEALSEAFHAKFKVGDIIRDTEIGSTYQIKEIRTGNAMLSGQYSTPMLGFETILRRFEHAPGVEIVDARSQK